MLISHKLRSNLEPSQNFVSFWTSFIWCPRKTSENNACCAWTTDPSTLTSFQLLVGEPLRGWANQCKLRCQIKNMLKNSKVEKLTGICPIKIQTDRPQLQRMKFLMDEKAAASGAQNASKHMSAHMALAISQTYLHGHWPFSREAANWLNPGIDALRRRLCPQASVAELCHLSRPSIHKGRFQICQSHFPWKFEDRSTPCFYLLPVSTVQHSSMYDV